MQLLHALTIRPATFIRLFGVAAVATIAAVGLMMSSNVASAAASTCTTKVYWDGGLSGRVYTDTCSTGVQIVASCAGSSIYGNDVNAVWDRFGLNGYPPFAQDCGKRDTAAYIYLRFQERGTWVVVDSSFYGNGGGAGYRTQSWVSR